MNRRGFLKACGLAVVAPGALAVVSETPASWPVGKSSEYFVDLQPSADSQKVWLIVEDDRHETVSRTLHVWPRANYVQARIWQDKNNYLHADLIGYDEVDF